MDASRGMPSSLPGLACPTALGQTPGLIAYHPISQAATEPTKRSGSWEAGHQHHSCLPGSCQQFWQVSHNNNKKEIPRSQHFLTENSSVVKILTSFRCKSNYGRLRSISTLRINLYSPQKRLDAIYHDSHRSRACSSGGTNATDWNVATIKLHFLIVLWFRRVSSTCCRSDSIRAKHMKGCGRKVSVAEVKMCNKHPEDRRGIRTISIRPRTEPFIKKNISAEFLKAFQP